ncbi:hypothetical protein PUR61_14165 [Streptomyces sp. BE20]|uniref:hypothetical protein n=1 Tax=Streptomyces sp. BE20 TaxID=3002525 RepID=UPI002E764895|nr:hypothetical protein [Streptomyces sp. BE20]MEE1823326.1 hypothetical protein [Streptomyces sp. BE20]
MSNTKRVLAAGILGTAALVGILTTPASADSAREPGAPTTPTTRGLTLERVNSPDVNQQQILEINSEAWGTFFD